MKNRNRMLLTLEERLELVKKSQVASPETAAKLVLRFSELCPACVFRKRLDMDSMYELIGEFLDISDVDLENYRGFCHSFRLVLENNDGLHRFDPCWIGRYRPTWGRLTNNAMVLLGLMLLDHVKGLAHPKDVYYCMQMTLQQYLDALVDISFGESGTPDQSRVELMRSRREMLLRDYDGSKPLQEVMADILNRYIAAWHDLDHLDHIIRCMAAYACYLEEEETGKSLLQEEKDKIRRFREALLQYEPGLDGRELLDPDKRYPDPNGYYFALAHEYPADIPDPASLDISPETLRSRLFLSGQDYNPAILQRLADESPSPDLGALLEKYISSNESVNAMQEINIAVAHLYALWVEPYLQLGEYHYEKHLEISGQDIKTYPARRTYEGGHRDDIPDGRGIFTDENGTVYDGEWKDGLPNGQGILTFADGLVYEGGFKDGRKHGYGVTSGGRSGGVFKGEHKDDLPNGQGTFNYGSGSVYEGEWKDGRKNGQGTMTYPDGRVYKGEWKGNRINGHGTMTYAEGDVYEGEWKDGKRNGHGTMTYADGTVCEGEWKDDEIERRDQ